MLRFLHQRCYQSLTQCRRQCHSVSADQNTIADTVSNAKEKYSKVIHLSEQEDTQNASFAVIQLAGTQYKVTTGDVVITEKQSDAKVGSIVKLNEILLVGSRNRTFIGQPRVPDFSVVARIEEQTLDAKIDIFKKKRRKNYRRWNGFRRQVTVMRILDIEETDSSKKEDTSTSEECVR